MNAEPFHFYSDAGHGWLAVTREDLELVNLSVDHFSGSSYINGETIYLEEDCDASLFLAAYEAFLGRAPNIVEHVERGDSRIRYYGRLSGSKFSFDLWRNMMAQYRSMIERAA
jgi:hypothetical protein